MKKKILILSSLVMLFVSCFSIQSFAGSYSEDDTFQEVNPNTTLRLAYAPDLYYMSYVGPYTSDPDILVLNDLYSGITQYNYDLVYNNNDSSNHLINQRISVTDDLGTSPTFEHYYFKMISYNMSYTGYSDLRVNMVSYPYDGSGLISSYSAYDIGFMYWEDLVISYRDIIQESTFSYVTIFQTPTAGIQEITFKLSGDLLNVYNNRLERLPFEYSTIGIQTNNTTSTSNPVNRVATFDIFSYFFDYLDLTESDFICLENVTLSIEVYSPSSGRTLDGFWGRWVNDSETHSVYDYYNSIIDELTPVEVIDFEDISYVDWIVNSVQSFIDFEIFPNFSIGNILSILVSMALAIWILKVFMGG